MPADVEKMISDPKATAHIENKGESKIGKWKDAPVDDPANYVHSTGCYAGTGVRGADDFSPSGFDDDAMRLAYTPYSSPCATCGYSTMVSEISYWSYCITCPTGYQVFPVYDDCTGMCVADANAVTLVALGLDDLETSSCTATTEAYDDDVVLAYEGNKVSPGASNLPAKALAGAAAMAAAAVAVVA
jgi:hypothetical protein